MPAKKKPIRVTFDYYKVLQEIVANASERACNRHDKYSDKPLTDSSRALLINEFENSFWLAVDETDPG